MQMTKLTQKEIENLNSLTSVKKLELIAKISTKQLKAKIYLLVKSIKHLRKKIITLILPLSETRARMKGTLSGSFYKGSTTLK